MNCIDDAHGAALGGALPADPPRPLPQRADLNAALMRHPLATHLLRVVGHAMRDARIEEGDTVMVDRAISPRHGHVVVALVDGHFTVRRLIRERRRGARGQGGLMLQAANSAYPPWVPREGQHLEVWGVVTHVIKHMEMDRGETDAGDHPATD